MPRAAIRKGRPTIRVQTFKALNNGELDDYDAEWEFDHAIAERTGGSYRTVAAYRQEWTKDRIRRGLAVPEEVVREIVTLRDEGWTFPEIVRMVDVAFECRVTTNLAYQIYKMRGGGNGVVSLAEADMTLPLHTAAGRVLVHCRRCRHRSCEECGEEMARLCKWLALRGDFIACEEPGEWELMPTREGDVKG